MRSRKTRLHAATRASKSWLGAGTRARLPASRMVDLDFLRSITLSRHNMENTFTPLRLWVHISSKENIYWAHIPTKDNIIKHCTLIFLGFVAPFRYNVVLGP